MVDITPSVSISSALFGDSIDSKRNSMKQTLDDIHLEILTPNGLWICVDLNSSEPFWLHSKVTMKIAIITAAIAATAKLLAFAVISKYNNLAISQSIAILCSLILSANCVLSLPFCSLPLPPLSVFLLTTLLRSIVCSSESFFFFSVDLFALFLIIFPVPTLVLLHLNKKIIRGLNNNRQSYQYY